jgi:hypothetical protein
MAAALVVTAAIASGQTDIKSPPKHEQINKVFVGKFEGTGRACYGHLTVTEKKISWKSSFSDCKTSDYKIIRQEEKDDTHRIVFERSKNNQKCLFPIVEMVHKNADKDYLNWNVTGYTSREQFDKDYIQERMTCLMIRL